MNPVVAPTAAPPPLPANPTRSVFVTVLAWVVIGVSALGVPVSLISLLMILAGSHGTANASWLGGLVVIGGPPATLIAGIGLLRRRRWAFAYMCALLVVVAAWNVGPMLRGPTPTHTYTSPGGVPTTVLGSDVNYPLHVLVIMVALGLLAKLLTQSVRAEFWRSVPPGDTPSRSVSGHTAVAGATRDWRVGHQGRDEMYYEERDGWTWRRLRISGEMLMGRAHHVIYFASPEAWLQYPEWARHRRDEIIARIKSEFRAPDYEYHGDGAAVTSPPPLRTTNPFVAPTLVPHAAPRASTRAARRPSGSRALLLAIAIMVGIAGGMGWLVQRGLTQGKTWFPTKRATLQRSVLREKEPALFWMSIGVYAVVGAGGLGLAAWGVREAVRPRFQGL